MVLSQSLLSGNILRHHGHHHRHKDCSKRVKTQNNFGMYRSLKLIGKKPNPYTFCISNKVKVNKFTFFFFFFDKRNCNYYYSCEFLYSACKYYIPKQKFAKRKAKCNLSLLEMESVQESLMLIMNNKITFSNSLQYNATIQLQILWILNLFLLFKSVT